MFDISYEFVRKMEGGFVDDPDDPGGRTNFGITQNVYDPTRKKDVKNITEPEIKNIYKSYWIECKADKIDIINPKLALIHFDDAFNCGPIQAAKLLQRTLGVKADGIIGPITLKAISDYQDDVELCKKYLDERLIFYKSLTIKRPVLTKFLKSWTHRLQKAAQKCEIDWQLK